MAEGRVVMLAGDGHQSVIALGQGGVDLACSIGTHEEGLAEEGVAGLGRSAVPAVLSRGVQ